MKKQVKLKKIAPAAAMLLSAYAAPYIIRNDIPRVWDHPLFPVLAALPGMTGMHVERLSIETLTAIGSFTVMPSGDRIRLYDVFFRRLLTDNLWGRYSLLYLFAAHHEQAGRVNLKSPGTGDITAMNSPTFTVDEGFTGDSSSSYLTTGVNWNSVTALDDSHAGAWVIGGAGATTSDDQLIGTAPAGGAPRILVRISSSNLQATLDTAALSTLGSISSVLGHWVVSRRGDTDLEAYRNGSSNGTSATASGTVPASPVDFLAHGGNRSDFQIACGHVGYGLTDTDAANEHTAFNEFLAAVGAV
jgi:hypothetical protein